MADQYQHLGQEMEPENFVGSIPMHGLNDPQRNIDIQPNLMRDFKHQYNPSNLIDVGLVQNSRYG
jgi:hypothetical protein